MFERWVERALEGSFRESLREISKETGRGRSKEILILTQNSNKSIKRGKL